MSATLRANQPIGIFDSGIGGLTVAGAVARLLPNERIVYFGDTAHLPYGDKSLEAIQGYSERIADFLLEKNCKLILIACNTASAAAYDTLKQHVGDRALLLNVIDPLVKAVAADDSIKKVGIIATKATISSGVYERKLKEAKPTLEVASLATALLASMIEAGFYNNSVSQAIINSYLSYPDFQDVSGMLLACTHYPLIRGEIDFYFRHRVKVFDSTDTAAHAVKEALEQNNLLNGESSGGKHFCVSDYTDSFAQTTKLFFGEAIALEHCPIWEG
ncbi:MAG TPA: glutamate racemase [Chitinophagales bacterium]|nr:glutamate racemase [Chitinophagales bacterium]